MVDLLQYTMNYEDGEQLLFCGDGSGVLNHSDNYNSQIVYNPENDYKKLRSVATRDIKAGEEITESYAFYPKMRQNWVEDIFRRYIPSRIEFEVTFKI